MLEIYTDYLGLDERGYAELTAEMWRLSASLRFNRLFAAIVAWLERMPTIDEDILTHAMRTVLAWPDERSAEHA